ncbi:MAG: 50S ribosomal protein L24e [Candidatus Aenigmarchaeota archaeon]|nr:50S ribosomal protein L24e [Candidatus Aenigmarchaeota archaeon]
MMKCTFCKETIEQGTGKMYVKTDGKVFYFCSKKCEKNMIFLGRESKHTKWVAKKKDKE